MRRSPQTVRVLAEFLRDEAQWRYGYDLGRETGLFSGTLYPILLRLAERGLLETSWEEPVGGRPPRHLYRLTVDGLRYARAQVKESSARKAGLGVPALGEVMG